MKKEKERKKSRKFADVGTVPDPEFFNIDLWQRKSVAAEVRKTLFAYKLGEANLRTRYRALQAKAKEYKEILEKNGLLNGETDLVK